MDPKESLLGVHSLIPYESHQSEVDDISTATGCLMIAMTSQALTEGSWESVSRFEHVMPCGDIADACGRILGGTASCGWWRSLVWLDWAVGWKGLPAENGGRGGHWSGVTSRPPM